MEVVFNLHSFSSLLYLLLIPLFYLIIIKTIQSKHQQIHPGPRPFPLLGNLPQFLANRARFLDWTTDLLAASPTGTIFIRRPWKPPMVITANPSNVEHMLKSRFDNYPKGDRMSNALHDFLGSGIFNADGERWKTQRKTASFEFSTKSMRQFVSEAVRDEIVHRLFPFLEAVADRGEVVNLQDALERFAFDNICRVAFDVDPACLGSGSSSCPGDFMSSFEAASELSVGRMRSAVPPLWRLKRLLNVGSERRLRSSIGTVHAFATDIIRSRMEEEASRGRSDLLSRFAEDGESSEERLRDVVVSFILAGRDTTSSVLARLFWVLSSRPDVVEKIRAELKSIRGARSAEGGEGEVFEFEELKEMHYTHGAISEALRLYPPVSVDSKLCASEDVLADGTSVGKGWVVAYNAYAMGRMVSIWGKDCLGFRPERWIDAEGKYRAAESPYKYPVFHAGPRMCLGREMAYIQMKSVAAAVVERFDMEVNDRTGTCGGHQRSLTLRMKGGLPVRVRRRG
ncbi:Cytochrome P450 94A1 [Acorus calamus]|uniref:Cytochrome P450 94A1 n=1 Tax=Acorus calamus TaxID=4465 RepID=A0AAV9DTP2_ACOCL|nr:Cytochrome P450 94A1 [Acorus calamus]